MKRIVSKLLVCISAGSMPFLISSPCKAAPEPGPRQILVEVVVLERPLDGTNAVTDFGLRNREGKGINNPTAGDDFEATLRSLTQDQRMKVLYRPRIHTSSGVPATLSIGETRPPGPSTSPTSASPPRVTGLTVGVTPCVKEGGLIELDLRFETQCLAGNMTTLKEIQSKVAVRDRQPILLGGLVQENTGQTTPTTRFPKELPGVPRTQGGRGELIFLLRSTLLGPNATAGAKEP